MIPFIDLKPALEEIRGDIDTAIRRVMDRGIFLNGPEVDVFESEFATYCGADYCVACASGTDALMLEAKAVDGPLISKEFRVPANSCAFTKVGIHRARAECCLCDVDERGAPDFQEWRVDERRVRVLLYGKYPNADMPVDGIVDACQAHGWKSSGHHASWSFYPTKNLGCFGDGGAITTSHSVIAAIARESATTWHSRLSELNAAVLRTKLPHLDRWNAERHKLAAVYYEELPQWADPVCRPGEPTNHHLFAVLVDRRDELEKHMTENGVGVKVHYREPLAELPGARRWCDRVLSLPMYPGLSPDEVRTVCDTIRSFR